MTEQISTITPNLYLAGLFIQDNVLHGYRLVEGSPASYGWQYEVVMELAGVPVTPPPTPERRSPGRPVKS